MSKVTLTKESRVVTPLHAHRVLFDQIICVHVNAAMNTNNSLRPALELNPCVQTVAQSHQWMPEGLWTVTREVKEEEKNQSTKE